MNRSYWRTVGLVTGWQIAASICYYAVFAATPFFRDIYGLDRFAVGLVVTALTLGYVTFVLPLGALTDRLGERRTLTVGLLGLATGVLLVAGAPTFPALLGAAFVLGATYGTAIPGTNKAIFDSIPAGRQNLAVGIKQVGVTGGSGISSLLVTGLAGVFFWQAGFLVAGGLAYLVAVAFYLAYRGAGKGGVTEYPGFRTLLANRSYLVLVVAALFLGAALFTTTGYTVLYVQEAIGTSVFFGGVVLAIVQLAGSVGRILTGWLSDTLPGEPRTRIGGMLVVQTLAGAGLFVAVAAASTPLGAALAFAALGFFVLGYTGVYYSVMATLVSAEEMGSATAGGQLAFMTGSLFAPPAFGYLADTVGYAPAWYMLGGATVVAAGLVVVVILTPPPVDTPAAAVEES